MESTRERWGGGGGGEVGLGGAGGCSTISDQEVTHD